MSYDSEVQADTPLAYYKLDEPSADLVLTDFTANLRNGTRTSNITRTTSLLSSSAHASYLDNSEIVVPAASWMNTTNVTAEIWVNANTNGLLLGHDNNGANLYWRLDISGGAIRWIVNVNGAYQSITAPYTFGTTKHVVGTYDGNILRIYVDGVLVTSSSVFAGSIPTAGTQEIRFGRASTGLEPIQAAVDAAAVYGTALTTARILAHYDARATTSFSVVSSPWATNGYNGLFDALGRNQGGGTWVNPSPSTVTVSASSIIDGSRGPEKALDQTTNEFHSTNAASGQWWMVDGGSGREFTLSHIGIQGRSDGFHHPRNFVVEISQDALSWTTSYTAVNEGTSSGTWWSVPINAVGRYLRIRMTGIGSSGDQYLVLGEVEVWGSLANTGNETAAPPTNLYTEKAGSTYLKVGWDNQNTNYIARDLTSTGWTRNSISHISNTDVFLINTQPSEVASIIDNDISAPTGRGSIGIQASISGTLGYLALGYVDASIPKTTLTSVGIYDQSTFYGVVLNILSGRVEFYFAGIKQGEVSNSSLKSTSYSAYSIKYSSATVGSMTIQIFANGISLGSYTHAISLPETPSSIAIGARSTSLSGIMKVTGTPSFTSSSVTRYDARTNGGTITAVSPGGYYLSTGLTANTSYLIEVRSVSSSGFESAWASANLSTYNGVGLLFDSFNRANSTTSLGTPTTGGPYTVTGATYGIQAEQAYLPTNSGSQWSWAVAPTAANFEASLDLSPVSTLPVGIIFRYSDANNWWAWCTRTQSNGVELWRKKAGSVVSVYRPSPELYTPVATLEVQARGEHILCKINGNLLHQREEAFNKNATQGGLIAYADAPAPTWRANNLSFEGAPMWWNAAEESGSAYTDYAQGAIPSQYDAIFAYLGRDTKTADVGAP